MVERYYTGYVNNQYEDYNGGKFSFGEEVLARYITQEEPTYQGNLLIEALPPIFSFEHLSEIIQRVPVFSEIEREKSITYRLHAVYRLQDYLLPMPKYLETEAKISIAIRRGYIGKNIMTPEFLKKLRFTSKFLSDVKASKQFKELIIASSNNSSDAPAYSIIGISGAGKTTAVNNILSFYPQNIVHTGFSTDKFLFRQLSWIKIDCTYNGSIKGICEKFFLQVDKILGTDYFRNYASATHTVDFMIIAMAHVAQIHGLGMLVIDEIQHLKKSKNGSVDSLNFFVCMMNEIRLPILYIGTYKAIDNLFAQEYRQGRRADGMGCVEWNRLMQDDEWNYFLEDMWQYQWTKNYTSLTQEINDIMYKKSMGIIDRAKKIFMAVQFDAIVSGLELITAKKIIEIADKNFILTKRFIDALEKDDIEEIAKFEDIKSTKIEHLFEHALEDAKRKEKVITLLNEINGAEKKKKNEIINDIVLLIIEFGYEYDKVLKITREVVDEFGIKKGLEFLKKKVANQLLEQDSTLGDKKENKKKENRKNNKHQIDIKEFNERSIVDTLQGVSTADDNNTI